MIRRGSATKTPSVVNAAESETLSVQKGIVRNAGPSDLASVVDSCNFSLREDGSYELRKPDVLLRSLGAATYPLHDGSRVFSVTSQGAAGVYDALAANGSAVKLRYVDAAGSYQTKADAVFKVSDTTDSSADVVISPSAKPMRAGDVTVIPALANRGRLSIVDGTLFPQSKTFLSRLLSIYEDAELGWVAELVAPEVNTLVNGGEGASFEPNLLLDNPYALRDLYGYGSVGVQGIVAYRDKEASSSSPAATYQKFSEGTVSKSVADALFRVDGKAGVFNLYANAHISLVDMSRYASPNAVMASSGELYAMDHEIGVSVSNAKFRYEGDSQDTVLWAFTRRCSAFIPAYTPLLTFKVPPKGGVRAGTLTIQITLECMGQSSWQFYAYPAPCSADSLHGMAGKPFTLSASQSITLTVGVDSSGNFTVRDAGFDFGFDKNGFYVEPDPAHAPAEFYSLAQAAFASDADALRSVVPYSQSSRTYLDPSQSSWSLWYKTWNLSSGSYEYTGLLNKRVSELTEAVGSPKYELLSALNANDGGPLILKAMMTFSHSMSNYYGVWETSSDGGVTWTPCVEFVRRWNASMVSLPITDLTYSGETLRSAYDYVKYVRAVPIVAQNQDDLATNRPDVLIVTDTPKTNQFRFTVYRYALSAAPDSAIPMCVATPDVGSIAASDRLPCPKSGSTYISGTHMDLGSLASQGIAVFFPDDSYTSGGGFTLRYALTDDMSRTLTDADCITVLSPESGNVSGYGTLYFLQEMYMPSMSRTHAVRLRFSLFRGTTPIPGHYVDAIYMYVSPSMVNDAEASSASIATSRSKFTTFPEPIVSVTAESGKLICKGAEYEFGDYGERSNDKFTKAATDLSVNSIVCMYSSEFKVYNPTNMNMLVALGAAVARDATFGYDVYEKASDGDYVGSDINSATISVDGDATTARFKYVSARWAKAALERGASVKYAVIPPKGSISVSYSYSLRTKLLGDSILDFISVATAIKAMAFPVEVVTLQGRITASAKAWTAFIRNRPSTSTSFHAIRHLSYYDDSMRIRPVYLAIYETLWDLNARYANGTLTGFDSAEEASPSTSAYVPKATAVSTLTYTAKLTDFSTECADYANAPDVVDAKHIYYEHIILTYGVKKHGNVLYVSGVDSYITPLQNAIEFSYGSDVTAVIPWRDYVIVFTENATYMLLKDASSPNGFSTRTVNASVGVPKSDGESVQAILNGILFKSGSKAYVYVPGRYSTVDTMLNIRRISDPIDGFLEEGADTLSFVQDDEWHLFQKTASGSFELVYNYAKGVWTRHSHRFFPNAHFLYGTAWRMLTYGSNKILSYGKYASDIKVPNSQGIPFDLSLLDTITYGDMLTGDFLGLVRVHGASLTPALSTFDSRVTPIAFSLDTGEKSSRFTVLKQFLELKFNVMSLDSKDAFPMSITVRADGMPHSAVVDANTDSPFWRESKTLDSGAAATTFGDDFTNNVGVMRQMFVKYSGRGKTLRLTVSGESQSRFAVYTFDSRYRVLPNKQ